MAIVVHFHKQVSKAYLGTASVGFCFSSNTCARVHDEHKCVEVRLRKGCNDVLAAVKVFHTVQEARKQPKKQTHITHIGESIMIE